MTSPPRRSFSYQGQDLLVVDLLDGMRGGFFLDSGASNGVKGNNTLLLETEFGWTGICVEPNAELFAHLAQHRTCICLNCCLYDRDGPVEFVEAAGVYGGILGEYDEGQLDWVRGWLAEPTGHGLPTRTMAARSIRSILREHRVPRVIDYWSLDTEGSELSILRSFPFDEHLIRVLTVEHNETAVRGEIRALLEAHGYRWVRSLGIDDCYVWGGRAAEPGWRSRAWSRQPAPRAR
jgi:FkbM family methyltransferase